MPNRDEKTGGLSGKTTAAFVALVLLAGCTDPLQDDGVPAATTAEPRDLTVWSNGTISAGIGLVVSASQGGATLDIDVPEGTRLLEAALDWDGPFDLDLCLSSPSAGTTSGVRNCDHAATGGTPASPDGPLLLQVMAPEAGLWQASPSINVAAADTDYRLRLTATGTTSPEGPPEP
ncbi:MAG: hypothetical protein ACPGQL_11375 [Thermoplasmatota archaeon]